MNLLKGFRPVSAAAPVYASDYTGLPVILGQPVVDGSAVGLLTGLMSVEGTPSPTVTYQWWRGEKGDVANAAISGATSSTYSPTKADCMKELWCVETKTNASGSVSSTSKRVRCLPSGWSVGMGAPADSGQSQDPATAASYSATTLYTMGDCVDVSGTQYICREPYSYGINPSSDATTWQVVTITNGVFYFDLSAGSNGTGTSASPFNTMDEVRKRCVQNSTGYSAAANGALFLFKRGTTGSGSVAISVFTAHPDTNLGTMPKFVFGTWSTGARPIINYAPPSQATITTSGYGNGDFFFIGGGGCMVTNLDLRCAGLGQIVMLPTGTSGTIAVADTVTFSGGGTGSIAAAFTHSGNQKYLFTIATGNPASGETFTTSSGGAGTCAGYDYVGAITGLNKQYWRVAYTDLTRSGLGGVRLDNTSGGTGDVVVLGSTFTHCHALGGNGAGIMGGAGTRDRVWSNTTTDCGNAGNTLGHEVYLDALVDSSVLLNNIVQTADFGNHAFIYHGTGSNVEIAWNKGSGTRSGWGLNDGYAAVETMDNFHFHHNFLKTVGTFSGQTSNSLAWEITCLTNSRIHDNVTYDIASTSLPAFFYDDRNSGGADSELSNTTIAHNTWFDCPVNIGTSNGGSGASIVALELKNNIFATALSTIPFLKGSTVPDAELTLDYNLYRRSTSTHIRWDNTGGAGSDYATAAALHAVETQAETNGVTGDPLFTNSTTGDFSLQGGSPARNVGVDMRRKLGYAADHAGVTRNDTSPHIGAFETA